MMRSYTNRRTNSINLLRCVFQTHRDALHYIVSFFDAGFVQIWCPSVPVKQPSIVDRLRKKTTALRFRVSLSLACLSCCLNSKRNRFYSIYAVLACLVSLCLSMYFYVYLRDRFCCCDDPLEDADADADEKKIDVIDQDDLPLTISCLPCAQESPSKGQKRKTQKRTAQRRQRRKTVWVAFRIHSEPLSHIVVT